MNYDADILNFFFEFCGRCLILYLGRLLIWDISESVILTGWFSREYKVVFNRRCLWCYCRCCLNRLLLLGRRTSVCIFDHLLICSAAFCLGFCLLCRLPTHFFSLTQLLLFVQGKREAELFGLILRYQRISPHSVGGFPLLWNEKRRNVKTDSAQISSNKCKNYLLKNRLTAHFKKFPSTIFTVVYFSRWPRDEITKHFPEI